MQPIEQPTPEQLAKRKSNLERKQRQRAREKAQSHQAMQDSSGEVKGDKMNAEGIARRTKRNQCTLGEISPGVDARTLEDALEVAREMARALVVPDVQEGETSSRLRAPCLQRLGQLRGLPWWKQLPLMVVDAPYLNRLTGELSPGLGKPYWEEYCGGFDESWQALPGAKKKLDLAALPKLKKLKRPRNRSLNQRRHQCPGTTGTNSAATTRRNQLRVDATRRAPISDTAANDRRLEPAHGLRRSYAPTGSKEVVNRKNSCRT